jgi:hypothetical protein
VNIAILGSLPLVSYLWHYKWALLAKQKEKVAKNYCTKFFNMKRFLSVSQNILNWIFKQLLYIFPNLFLNFGQVGKLLYV